MLLLVGSSNGFLDFLAKALGVVNQIQTPLQVVALGLILLAFIFVVLMWKINPRDKNQLGFIKPIVLLLLVIFFILLLAALFVTFDGSKKAAAIESTFIENPQMKALLKPLDLRLSGDRSEVAGQVRVPQGLDTSLDELTTTSLFYVKAGVTDFARPATTVASLAFFANQPERAKDLLTASVALDPSPRSLNDLGVIFYDAAQQESDLQKRKDLLATATSYFQKALAEDPRLVQAINNMGLIAYTNDQLAAALDRFNEALALDPSYLNALNNRGLTYRKLGLRTDDPQERADLLQKAEADFEAVLRQNPNLEATHYNLALLEENLGNAERAAEHYEKAIQLNLRRTIAFNNLSFIYSQNEKLKNSERAVYLAEQALALKPNDPCFLDTLAHAHLANGECDEAVTTSENSLQQFAAATMRPACAEEELRTSLERIRRECGR